MILLLAEFGNGLLFLDLEIMTNLSLTPPNTIDLLRILTKFKQETDDSNAPSLKLTRKTSQIEPNPGFFIEPNSYLWFNIDKDKKDETLSIKINHFLTSKFKTKKNFWLHIYYN